MLMAFLVASCSYKAKENAEVRDVNTEEANPQSIEDIVKVNLEHILYDIGQQKSERFHWLTKEDVMEINGGKTEGYEDGNLYKFIVENPVEWKKEIERALGAFKKEGDRCGFNFNNYSFESVEVETKVDEESKGNVCRGTAVLKSDGKLVDLEFKNLVLMDNDAKYVDGFGIMPHGQSQDDEF